MVLEYTVNGDSFVTGKPRLWSDKHLSYAGYMNLDLAPDGKRFVVQIPAENGGPREASVRIMFLLNFFDYLRQRVLTGAK